MVAEQLTEADLASRFSEIVEGFRTGLTERPDARTCACHTMILRFFEIWVEIRRFYGHDDQRH